MGVGEPLGIRYTLLMCCLEDPVSDKSDQTNRPITEALESLRVDEEETAYDPIETLASLMDLRGSVDLARYLAELPPLPDVEPSHPAAVLALTAKVIEDVRSRLDFGFENAFRPRFRLPNAQRAWSVLQRSGVLESLESGTKRQQNAAIKSATRIIWAPFGEFLETRLKRSRFALRELREELSGPIAGLGPDAGRLERMDSALRMAVSHEVDRLYRRVGHTVESHFATELRRAIDDLPTVADKEGFSMGFSEKGWLGEIFRKGQAMILGIVEHEIGQVQSLVHSSVKLHHESS